MQLEVRLSGFFSDLYDQLPDRDLDLIDAFWDHCERYGHESWKGKVKPSWDLPWDYPFRSQRVSHAREHNLWHAHIGFPEWKPSKNLNATYQVSDWVIHFQNFSTVGYIKLVGYGFHNPFHLPDLTHLP
jgi:hypothetical protein